MLRKIKRFFQPRVIVQENPAVAKILIENYIRDMLRDDPRYADTRQLNRFEYQVFSQYGEDGIIEEIFRRIGTTNQYFVEFGVETGVECNTTLLLHKEWKGTWIEGNKESVETIRQHFVKKIADGELTVVNAFITAENIAGLFQSAGVPAEPDLLSIDIDRNDFYIWESLTHYRPRVVCIEYNSVFPPGVHFKVPYDAGKVWDGSSDFGASVTSLAELGNRLDYSLVACSLAGVNAFFVRNDCLQDKFLSPGNVAAHYQPARYYLYKKEGHPRKVNL